MKKVLWCVFGAAGIFTTGLMGFSRVQPTPTPKLSPAGKSPAAKDEDCPPIGGLTNKEATVKVTGKLAKAMALQEKLAAAPNKKGDTADKKTIAADDSYQGHWEETALKCDEPCPKGLEFHVPHKNEGSDWCVFSIIRGPRYTGAGNIVPAKDVPEIEDGEPMYQATAGYGIFGGSWPVARARRSRAGAPGTQFAVELDIDPNGYEWYYLINAEPKHSVRVCGGDAGWANCVSITDNKHYIEVDPTGKASVLDLAMAPQARRDFAAKAAKIAKDCNLPGADKKLMKALDEINDLDAARKK